MAPAAPIRIGLQELQKMHKLSDAQDFAQFQHGLRTMIREKSGNMREPGTLTAGHQNIRHNGEAAG
jgi:hypothetical protein